jgi:hypothetical protein
VGLNISKINPMINYRTNAVMISIIQNDFDSGLINKFIRLEFYPYMGAFKAIFLS